LNSSSTDDASSVFHRAGTGTDHSKQQQQQMPVDSPTSSNASSLTPVPDFAPAVRTSRDFREDKREGVPVGLLKKVEELGITVAHHQNEASTLNP
jgi:hypothetical protein